MDASTVSLALTPHGHVVLLPSADAPTLPEELQRRLEETFERGAAYGLLDLGLREVGKALPPVFAFWRDFGARYVSTLCTSSNATEDGAAARTIAAPSMEQLDELVAAAPPMRGGEYLTTDVLESLWQQVDRACRAERVESKQSLQAYLKAHDPAWNLVGRVHFNLAENRSDQEAPFAFIATYTTQLSAQGRAQHLPLAEALREYAGAQEQGAAALLAAARPTRGRAVRLAARDGRGGRDLPSVALDAAGGAAISDGRAGAEDGRHRGAHAERLGLRATSAAAGPGHPRRTCSVDCWAKAALLDFSVELTLGDERLTADEIRSLLAGSDGLQFLRGRWVEVDRQKLSRLLERFRGWRNRPPLVECRSQRLCG